MRLPTWPVDGIRERVFADLDTAVVIAVGNKTPAQKFSRVKIWRTLTPVAALLHVEAGYSLLRKGQNPAGVRHLLLARLMADWDRWSYILEYLPDEAEKAAYKQLRRDVYLAIAWILQSAVEENTLDGTPGRWHARNSRTRPRSGWPADPPKSWSPSPPC